MFCFSILHIIMKHRPTSSSRRITLIFDIFRIGVVTDYRGRMLNLYSVYSNVRRLCALLCPAISFLHFHVPHFHALQIGPSFSRPAFSAPPHRSLRSARTPTCASAGCCYGFKAKCVL